MRAATLALAVWIGMLGGMLAGDAPGSASAVNKVLVQLKKPKKGIAPQRFEVLEKDVNAWAAVAIQSKKRLGVKKMLFDFKSANRFTTTMQVNMDDVELTGFTIRMFQAILSGTQTLEADGQLTVDGDRATYAIEAARVNGISVPAWLVSSVVSYLGKRQPPYVDPTEPFDLPFGIRELRVFTDKVVVTR